MEVNVRHRRTRCAVVAILLWIASLGSSQMNAAPVATAAPPPPSPGPISTVGPMPCASGGRPTRTDFLIDSAPSDHVPTRRSISRRDRVLKLYKALCGLPALDVQTLHCLPGRHEVVYSVHILLGRTTLLSVGLDMGGCQLATNMNHGYIAFYRIPRKVVDLVARLLGVPAERLRSP